MADVKDLKLRDYGFESLERNPSSFSPFPDGRYLLMGPDDQLNHREIAKFSAKDADNYPKYEQMLLRVATVIEPTLVQVPVNVLHPGLGGYWKLAMLGRKLQGLGPAMLEATSFITTAQPPKVAKTQ